MDMITNFNDETLSIGVVALRVALAVLLGGLIGLERGVRSHPAGFRTHILVCVGACLAMLTNQFVFEGIGAPGTDPTRIGAQVISGIGFLGVGTIFMAGRNTVKGLTTAAGLWASGAIGLAAGIGFYAGAAIAAAIVLAVLGIFPVFEASIYKKVRVLQLRVEFSSIEAERSFAERLAADGHVIRAREVLAVSNIEGRVTASYALRLKRGVESEDIIEALAEYAGVRAIEIQ